MTKNITWFTAKEIADDKELIDRVETYDIRKCRSCGAYVNVEDFMNESDIYYIDEICTECNDSFVEDPNAIIELVEHCSYDEYLDEEDYEYEESYCC